MQTRTIDSPVGYLRLSATGDALALLAFTKQRSKVCDDSHILDEVEAELDAYFAGTLKRFSIPLARERGTDLERTIWKELERIAYGEHRSYSDVAKAVGKPRAVRAVGRANGKNPIAIIVPCHRVIGKDGSLVGFGGGLETKRWLLAHEARFSRCATGS